LNLQNREDVQLPIFHHYTFEMEYPLKLRILNNEVFGKKITLNDDSVWWVYYPDSVKSMHWLPNDEVVLRRKKDMESWTVKTNAFPPYDTIMEHLKSGKMVGADRETYPRLLRPTQ